MDDSTHTMAQQIAEVVGSFQQRRTGLRPASVSVVLGGDTLVVTLYGALSPAEKDLSLTLDGAEKVQEFHRQLFLDDADSLRKEIEKITGMQVRGVTAEVEPASGTVVHVFTSGTMVQVFLLSGQVPTGSFESIRKP